MSNSSSVGAREALIEVVQEFSSETEEREDATIAADWLLAQLWSRGYKVVALEASDEPADS